MVGHYKFMLSNHLEGKTCAKAKEIVIGHYCSMAWSIDLPDINYEFLTAIDMFPIYF